MSDESIAPGPTDRREFEAGLSDLIEAAREHDVSVRGAYTVPSRDTDSRDVEAHITEIADD